MNISHFTVDRPIFTAMLTCLVLVLGSVALMRIPVDLMPDITEPRISITTTYENASPEEVEELITRKIEEAVSSVTGVDEIDSISGEGASRVTVAFAWGTDIDSVSNDVRDRLDRIYASLPEKAERPSLRKYNPSEFPVLIMGTSSNLDPLKLRYIIDEHIQPRMERAPGIAAVDVVGGLEREIHVDLDSEKVKALKLSVNTIVERIEKGNLNLPAGSVYRGRLDVRIRTPGLYTGLDEIRNTIVAMVGDAPIRVMDIGVVEDAWKEETNHVLVNGKSGLILRVNKQSGANTVEVVRGVMREVAKINKDFPELEIVPIINSAKYIEQSIKNLGQSAMYGACFAVFILLFFLRNIRSTFIVAVAIPISVIATFLLIYFGGFTLNIMTLGGLALGIGMLVDSSIVVVENILRLHDRGIDRKTAARAGSEEVTSAIIASTFTTLVVFLPLILMRGMSGIMFKQLALVVSFSLFCSLMVAVSLVPMLASRLMAPTAVNGHSSRTLKNRLLSLSNNMFMRLEDLYRDTLHWALSHRIVTAVACLLILVGSLAFIPLIGTELMPETDEGEVRVEGEMEVGMRLDLVRQTMDAIYPIIVKSTPEIESSLAFIGGRPWRPGSANTGEFRINLKPLDQRTRSDLEIADDLAKRLTHIPGVKIRTRKGSGFFLLRRATGSTERLNVEIRGHELKTASALVDQVVPLIEAVPGVTDTRVSQTLGTPEQRIIVDRQKAEEMKLTVTQISETLETALSGSSAGEYRDGGNEYRILVKVRDARWLSLRDILDLTVTNQEGEPIVLRNVVKIEPQTGPTSIERKNQQRYIEVRVNIRGRDMGSVAADINKALKSVAVPENFQVAVTGDYEEQGKSFRELMMSFGLAILLVYMVMACQFESLRDPFVVMFSVPFASVGVILMLFFTNTTLNLQSFIGCIMLAGIVVNNAILLVDHTNLLRRRDGLALQQAIEEAGRRRLRPILMTALTTSLALTPLALGMGEGGEAQAPMARAVIGGLLSSTLISLILVPVVYSILEWKNGKSPDGEAPKLST
ncbi:MAG: efflux RND transporter permease subunit [Deltaproteobacteria bacterium]|nr:efflux RND transporter permease subunit [Deltaproteobacteria bacterium]